MKNIKGLNITILGAVRSGIAAAKLALNKGAIPFVSDISKNIIHITELDDLNISYELGMHSEKVFDCDFIITSPGVPQNAQVLVDAIDRGIKIISEIEFASWFCEGEIIAITGSNGKTTTTELCSMLLNNSGIKAYSAGNIGVAFSEIVSGVKHDEFVVLEVSSFQLDFIDEFKPKYSVILNITPDHLDRYENSIEKYTQSKLRIFENLDEHDYAIYNADDSSFDNKISTKGNILKISLDKAVSSGTFIKDGRFVFAKESYEDVVTPVTSLRLKGEHNRYNAMAVITIAKLIGIENRKIESALEKFKGVEHRLEFVREINGIEFVNDSKATNVDSVWYALQSYNKPIRLILGGKDKGNDYSALAEVVSRNVKKIYAIGSSAEKISEFFGDITEVEIVDTLEGSVDKAFRESGSDEVILLSPACASFDMFDNYEHRGKVFKQVVNSL